MKRYLLLGRKAMTNLDSVLKSRDITLPAKVCRVNAMVSPVVRLRMCELDYKETLVPKNWCFWTVVLEKTLEGPLDCKEIKLVNPTGNQLRIFIGRIMKLQYFGHSKTAKSWLLEKTLMLGKIEGRKRRGWNRMNSLDSNTNSVNISLSKLWETVKDRESWNAAVHGVAKSQIWHNC